MMNIRWFYLLLVIFFIGCASDKQISKGSVTLTNHKVPSEHGLWYYLPKTVIKVEIIAEKEVAKAGPFFRFSQRFLNISDVITEDREGWRIIGANISTCGIADNKKLFKVSTEGTPAMAALSLTVDGVLKSVNYSQFFDFEVDNVKEQIPVKSISLENINFNNVPFSEEQLIKSSTTAMAEEVAKEIYRLRQLKNRLIKGDVDLFPPDAGAFEQVFAEINRLEQAYLSLFTGKIEKQIFRKVYDFIPEEITTTNPVLLRFSQQKGFLESMDVSGTPVYIEIDVNTKNTNNYILDEDKKTINKSGLAVCNPVPAKVRIIDRTTLLTENKILLGQFGQVYRLPKDLLNNSNVGILFDQSTGAVREVVID